MSMDRRSFCKAVWGVPAGLTSGGISCSHPMLALLLQPSVGALAPEPITPATFVLDNVLDHPLYFLAEDAAQL